MKTVKAEKEYKCDLTNKTISVGESYKRVNIRDVGIFHFKKECSDYEVKNYINNYINEHYCLEEFPTHLFACGENGFEY